MTCSGSLRIARSRALAGPVGSRRPCSQLRRVLTCTPSRVAKSGWLSLVRLRSSLIVAESTLNVREGARSPRAIAPACFTLTNNSSKIAFFISVPLPASPTVCGRRIRPQRLLEEPGKDRSLDEDHAPAVRQWRIVRQWRSFGDGFRG